MRSHRQSHFQNFSSYSYSFRGAIDYKNHLPYSLFVCNGFSSDENAALNWTLSNVQEPVRMHANSGNTSGHGNRVHDRDEKKRRKTQRIRTKRIVHAHSHMPM